MSAISIDRVHEIIRNAFEVTCFMFPLEDWEQDLREENDFLMEHPGAVVRFRGAAKGGMVIRPSDNLYEATAANMLGLDNPTQEEKAGALCEMANIICGNTVPLFAKEGRICTILPPFMADPHQPSDLLFRGHHKETCQIHFDEGMAEITLYHEEDHD